MNNNNQADFSSSNSTEKAKTIGSAAYKHAVNYSGVKAKSIDYKSPQDYLFTQVLDFIFSLFTKKR